MRHVNNKNIHKRHMIVTKFQSDHVFHSASNVLCSQNINKSILLANWQRTAVARNYYPHVKSKEKTKGPFYLWTQMLKSLILVFITTPSAGETDVAGRDTVHVTLNSPFKFKSSLSFLLSETRSGYFLRVFYHKCVKLPISFPCF